MTATPIAESFDGIRQLPLTQLFDSDDNPRNDLGPLDELAASIVAVGIIQPLVVAANGPHGYRIVAGHRRAAAAQVAGLDTVPCIHRGFRSDAERQEVMLVENLQRQDLSPLDEARGFQALADLGHSQRQIAERVGCNQSHVSRRLALLELDDEQVQALERGEVTVRAAEQTARPPKPKPQPEAPISPTGNLPADAPEPTRDLLAGLREELDRWDDFVDRLMWSTGDEWDLDESQQSIAIRYVDRLRAEVIRLAGCTRPDCLWKDNEPCDHGYVPHPVPKPAHWPAAAQHNRPGEVTLHDPQVHTMAVVDDIEWGGDDDPADAAEQIAEADAEWSADRGFNVTKSDYPIADLGGRAEQIHDEVIEGRPLIAGRPDILQRTPWSGYMAAKEAKLVERIRRLTDASKVRHLIAYEWAKGGRRSAILAAALQRLDDLAWEAGE